MPNQSEYVVIFKTISSARLFPDQGLEFFINVPGCSDRVRFRMFTQWIDTGHEAPTPRELIIESRGHAPSLDAAMSKGTAAARFLANILAFVANVPVGQPEVHIAFDATPGIKNREFAEVFLPDERGLPTEGRRVDPDEYRAVFIGANATGSSRLFRALQQYDIALRYWYYGGEWLALAHLYMAVETLSRSMIKRHCTDQGISEEQLARSVGIDTEKDWKHPLEIWSRKTAIFKDDNATYRAARRASDGIEHGIFELTDVHANALAATDKTWEYVREALLWLCKVDEAAHLELHSRRPRDVRSLRKIVRGRFVGDGSDPAPEGKLHPHLEWSSTIKTAKFVDEKLVYTFQENMKVHCAPAYVFQGSGFEIRGRTEPGSDPINLDPVVTVSAGPEGRAQKDAALTLLNEIVSLATETATPSGTLGVKPSRLHALDIYANQIGLVESISLLLREDHLIEGMLLTHTAMLGACRLEIIANAADIAAIGLRLQSLERQRSIYPDANIVAALGQEVDGFRSILQKLESGGEYRLIGIHETEFYRAHESDIRFTAEVAQAEDLAARMRVENNGSGRAIRTSVTDEKLRAGVACSAGEALISSIKSLGAAMEWPVASERLSDIEEHLKRLAESAAGTQATDPPGTVSADSEPPNL